MVFHFSQETRRTTKYSLAKRRRDRESFPVRIARPQVSFAFGIVPSQPTSSTKILESLVKSYLFVICAMLLKRFKSSSITDVLTVGKVTVNKM